MSDIIDKLEGLTVRYLYSESGMPGYIKLEDALALVREHLAQTAIEQAEMKGKGE